MMFHPYRRLPFRAKILIVVSLLAVLAVPIAIVVPNPYSFVVIYAGLIGGFGAVWKLRRGN